MAGLYLGLLIILVPTLYMLPDKSFVKLMDDKDQAIVLSQDAISSMYQHLPLAVNLDTQQGIYRLSSQTFKVDTKQLSFNIDGAINSGNHQIFVERKDVDDGEIEVSTYEATQLVGGIDFTKLILPLTVSYQNGTLSFRSAGRQTFDFRQFNPDFTVNQFKGQTFWDLNRGSSIFSGQIIYLRVPKSLEIDQGKYNDYIRMLNGETP
ncbi:hypothetical protein [Desulfosporosinus sp. I2]|uniref:hypothetical protein n=1 Tax=Desulfosporosinus sp. I2 TaxID=1617025 RepID=UPI0012E0B18C|nr:hypothetical protein [Desulfosporosinus sp. I2]